MSTNWASTSLDIYNRLNSYVAASSVSSSNYDTIKIDTMSTPSSAYDFMVQDWFDSVEYDSSHLWFCQLEGAPAPFDRWFPAQTIDEPMKGVSTSTMSFGIEEVNTLNSYSAVSFRAELLDDANATLETWLKLWQKNLSKNVNGIDYAGFRYIDEVLKKLYITKYNWQKQRVYTRLYLVIPSGDIMSSHNNEPTLKILNVTFAVFGSSDLINDRF